MGGETMSANCEDYLFFYAQLLADSFQVVVDLALYSFPPTFFLDGSFSPVEYREYVFLWTAWFVPPCIYYVPNLVMYVNHDLLVCYRVRVFRLISDER